MITSKDNPRVKRWAKLVQDARARREEGRLVVEGPHLVAEALQAGLEPVALMVSESGLARTDVQKLLGKRDPVVLGDRVFKVLADAESPQGIAAEIGLPRIEGKGDCVFLEGVQDPANVGAILRTAAAFGIGEVVLDRACADPWAPKALRAGMGGHFKLAIRQVFEIGQVVESFAGTSLGTVVSEGTALPAAQLDGRLGWIFGGEGRGVTDDVARRASMRIRIPTRAGTESLNVAAAAAVCLYEAFRRRQESGL
ncbi:MAG TPA: RNA methyltransferase [Burkholderiales bacterium]|nr:RNA methyltransferase [Burkholderiales bacterium]